MRSQFWVAVLAALFVSTASRPSHAAEPLTMTLALVSGRSTGSRCAPPVMKAVITNTRNRAVWLELGGPKDLLTPSALFVVHTVGEALGLASIGMGCWAPPPLEYLRGPQATMLRPSQSATRTIELDVEFEEGTFELDATLRIGGTDDLANPIVRAYSLEATTKARLVRRGECLVVARRARGR